MNAFRLLRIITLIGISAASAQQTDVTMSDAYPYRAALISTFGLVPGRTVLLVFPFQGNVLRLPIRSASGPFAYGPDGRAIYGQCTAEQAGAEKQNSVKLCRIDLQTNTMTPVAGSTGLYAAHLTVSAKADHIIVAGVHRQNGDVRGLFDLDVKRGSVRLILAQSDISAKSGWAQLSLSPDGERAIALRNDRLELINITRGTLESLQATLFAAAWSPAGKWVAALERGEKGNTILLDARDLRSQRVLGPSELDWSPDSRYLLGLQANTSCGPEIGSLEAIDIQTGERKTITSSECKVSQATTGWVRADIGYSEREN